VRYKSTQQLIDTHNLLLENEDPIEMIEKYFNNISHIHVSENNLLPISNLEFHKKFSKKLKSVEYNGIITYELLPCDNLEYQIKKFKKIYN
jgi:sugar phosphate isomerase/epimerase